MSDRLPESPFQREAAEEINKTLGNTIPEVLSSDKGVPILNNFEKTYELEAENEKFKKESRTNFLTDLPNERALSEFLSGLEDAWSRSGIDPNGDRLIHGSAIAIDLTKLKKTNEKFGRETGDLYLLSVTKALKKTLRAEDHVFRLGTESDEFSVFVPNLMDKVQLNKFMDRIDEHLKEEETKARIKHKDINFSLSYAAVRYNIAIGPSAAFKRSHTEISDAKSENEKTTGERGGAVGRIII